MGIGISNFPISRRSRSLPLWMVSFAFLCMALCSTLKSSGQGYVLEKKDTSDIRFINKAKFYLYKVEKGETIYSITKKFSVTEEALLQFNPELKDGLKNKMKLWVPATGLAGAMPTAPVTAEPAKPKDVPLEWVLLLPLHIDKQSISGELLTDSLVLSEGLNRETMASLEFYEGVLYALQQGQGKRKVNLSVYDTQEDTTVTGRLLRQPSLRSADVVFVSASIPVLKQVNQFSRLNAIPVISVSMTSADVFKDNPHAVALLPSSLMQCRRMGQAAAALNKGAQCMIVRSSNPKEAERGKAFLSGWKADSAQTTVKELTLDKNFPSVEDSLSSKVPNVIFVPSSNEDFVSSLLVVLDQVTADKKFSLIGIPTWQYFETLNPGQLEKMNTYLFAISSIDYEAGASLEFRKYCRETYGNEPSDQSYQGCDMVHLLQRAFSEDGSLIDNLRKKEFEGLFTTYHFVPAGTYTENDFIYVLKYTDYHLVKTDFRK